MKNFSLELASSILGLELQKEKIFSDENKKNKLCFCRSKILKTYISVGQLFHIRLMSKIIKFLEDYNTKATIERGNLKHWYMNEMYDKLLTKNCINNKMILLMRLLQDKTDNDFFTEYDLRFKTLIEGFNGDNEYLLNGFREFFFFINEWMENHILGILSCKIDCFNLDDKIYQDYAEFLINSECVLDLNICSVQSECNSCIRFNGQECGGCPSRHNYDNGETLHIYLTDEMIKDNHICNFIDTIYMYHKNPKNIDLIFDYVMFDDPMTFDYEKMDRMQTLIGRFKSLKIINAENVDFGDDIEMIRSFLEAKEMI